MTSQTRRLEPPFKRSSIIKKSIFERKGPSVGIKWLLWSLSRIAHSGGLFNTGLDLLMVRHFCWWLDPSIFLVAVGVLVFHWGNAPWPLEDIRAAKCPLSRRPDRYDGGINDDIVTESLGAIGDTVSMVGISQWGPCHWKYISVSCFVFVGWVYFLLQYAKPLIWGIRI